MVTKEKHIKAQTRVSSAREADTPAFRMNCDVGAFVRQHRRVPMLGAAARNAFCMRACVADTCLLLLSNRRLRFIIRFMSIRTGSAYCRCAAYTYV